jgi:hypothetical protein
MEQAVIKRIMCCAMALVLSLSAPAFPQENDPNILPENVEKLSASRPIIEYAVAGGVLLGALAIGFMPSKRTKEA